jgi:hypothetical protein
VMINFIAKIEMRCWSQTSFLQFISFKNVPNKGMVVLHLVSKCNHLMFT